MSNIIRILKIDLTRILSFNKFKKSKNKLKNILLVAIVVIVILALFSYVGLYTYLGTNFLIKYGLENYIIPMIYFAGSFVIFYTTIYKAKAYLFNMDDTLFAMPIKPSTILVSRIITLITASYIIAGVIYIPAILTYGFILKLDIIYYIFAFLGFLFMPLLPNVFGAIIGYIIAYFTSKVGNKKIFETVLTYGFVLLIMYLSTNLKNIALKFIDSAENINEILNSSGFLINNFMQMITKYSIKDLLIYIIVNIISVVLFVYIFKNSYIKILQTLKIEKTKNKYIEKKHKNKGEILTLLIKEFKKYISIPIYILNTSFGVILIFFASIATLFYDKEVLFKMFELEYSSLPIFAMFLLIITFGILPSNTAASSISIEGKNFWILKTLPIKVENIFFSKILLNILIVFPLSVLTIVLFSVAFKFTITKMLIAIIFTLILNITCAMFGIIINLKYPRLDFVSYAQVVKQSMSGFLATFIPMILWFTMIALYIKLNLTIEEYILVVLALLLILIMVQYYILKKWGVKRFREIS